MWNTDKYNEILQRFVSMFMITNLCLLYTLSQVCKDTTLNIVALKTHYFVAGKFGLYFIYVLIFSVITLWHLLHVLVRSCFARHFVNSFLWELLKIRYVKCHSDGSRKRNQTDGYKNWDQWSKLIICQYCEKFKAGPLTVFIFLMQESYSKELWTNIHVT